jgi:hypothetical protein
VIYRCNDVNPEEEVQAVEPTDYLAKAEIDGVRYGVDLSYQVWNLDTMEVVYEEHGDGEIDLRQVLEGEEKYDSGEPFDFNDFLTECLTDVVLE